MDSPQPLISVIIPVYNTAPYLRKCLDSVCGQSYTNLEIICVDDGSTDDSARILAEYAARDKRIIIITQENAGQAAARNAALKIATGTWITGVDSDDYIEKDTYEYCINSIPPNQEVKLLVYHFDVINGDTGQLIRQEMSLGYGVVKTAPQILYNTVCYFVNKLWHRDILSLPGASFPEGMWFEDVVFFYRVAPYLPQILYLSEVKYHYARYSGFQSSMDKARALPHKNRERVLAVETALKHYAQHPLPDSMQHLAPGLLVRFYNELCAYLTPETETPAWNMLRSIIERYGLHSTLCNTPELALCYYIPPCALSMHKQRFVPREDFDLFLSLSRLRQRYCWLLFQKLFTTGKSRRKIAIELDYIKQKLRWLRFCRRRAWKTVRAEISTLTDISA